MTQRAQKRNWLAGKAHGSNLATPRKDIERTEDPHGRVPNCAGKRIEQVRYKMAACNEKPNRVR